MIDNTERRINKDLEKKFKVEDSRFQCALSAVNTFTNLDTLQRSKAELLVEQKYSLRKNGERTADNTMSFELSAERVIATECLESFKPGGLKVISPCTKGRILLSFSSLNQNEKKVHNESRLEGITHTGL